MQAEPQKEHKWLQRMVGDWTLEGECIMGPDQPPSKYKGSESVRSLGGLWVICESKGEMPDGNPYSAIMTLGYDTNQKRFVGTWIGSMMTQLWLYDASMDAAGKVLTLCAEGPNMCAEGTLAKYKDVIEVKSDDHRVMTSQMQGEDGKWTQFMTANFRRKK